MGTPVKLKTCRKGLHQYSTSEKCCPKCKAASSRRGYLKWKANNPERCREFGYEWRAEHPKYHSEASRKWRAEKPEKRNASTAKYRASKKQAIPSWADNEAIKNIYLECINQTQKTGIKHDVDHIYPLTSDYMCGLHVETNLQILTHMKNIVKGNRMWPGQFDCQKGSVYAIFPKELTDLLND